MRLFQTASTAFALFVATAVSASTILLKAGDYGDTSFACNEEPNAGIASFDGRNFSYAHASRCTDTVKARSAGVLTVSETCRALGDGSPAKPDTMTFKMRLKGPERFDLIKGNVSRTFRRCGALGYFDKH